MITIIGFIIYCLKRKIQRKNNSLFFIYNVITNKFYCKFIIIFINISLNTEESSYLSINMAIYNIENSRSSISSAPLTGT